MKIVYNSPSDAVEFDIERYYNSLNKYGEVSKEQIQAALKELHYDPMHYTVLIETGVQLLPDDESAKKYLDEHDFLSKSFERLRRITGYLVGSLERWNDGKKAEEKARVKHNITGQYTPKEKAIREAVKLEELAAAQM